MDRSYSDSYNVCAEFVETVREFLKGEYDNDAETARSDPIYHYRDFLSFQILK